MVEEIRNMWCDVLEELLQCPVCLEAAVGPKFQCTNGHHICTSCRTHMASCPLCKSSILHTRNLAVEQITAKLDEIKLSLLHPYHAINRRILKNKVCVATQTDNLSSISKTSWSQTESLLLDSLSNDESNNSDASSILSPKIGKGQYPCRIGSCTMELPHGRMIGHLRYYHRDVFIEYYKKVTTFKRTWQMEYSRHQNYDYAFFIGGMGLFFLNVSVNHNGDFTGNLQIVNSNESAKQFTYTLQAESGTRKMCYTGMVRSCRTDKQLFWNDCLYVSSNVMRHMTNTKNNNFRCYLTIQRKLDYKENTAEENFKFIRNFRR